MNRIVFDVTSSKKNKFCINRTFSNPPKSACNRSRRSCDHPRTQLWWNKSRFDTCKQQKSPQIVDTHYLYQFLNPLTRLENAHFRLFRIIKETDSMTDKVKADLTEEICVIIRGKIAKAVETTAITTVMISKTSVADIKQNSIDFYCAR